MPEGRYNGGEMRLVYERMRSAKPHVFHLPWFPALREKHLHEAFDDATSEVMQWCRENLPEGSWKTEADGMQIRSIHTADAALATAIRVRWC